MKFSQFISAIKLLPAETNIKENSMTKKTVKFLPAILAASVLALTSCDKNEMETMQEETATSGTLRTTPSPDTPDNGEYIVVLKDGQVQTDEQIQDGARKMLGDGEENLS